MKCRLPTVKFSSGRDFKYSTRVASVTVESEIEENEFKQTRVSWKNLAAEKFSNNFHIFNSEIFRYWPRLLRARWLALAFSIFWH